MMNGDSTNDSKLPVKATGSASTLHISELIIEAQEAERRRIARELHDSVNQLLSSVIFRMGMIEGRVSAEDTDFFDEVQRVKMLLTKGLDEIRRISEDLRPSELDTLGLAPALRSLCGEFQEKNHIKIKFECKLGQKRLPDTIELTLYRIIQEAFNNIDKHAGATEVALALAWDGSELNLQISDNGCGFSGEPGHSSKKSGMGLLNMRERTAFLSGTFAMTSTPGRGTDISVRIPFHGTEQKMEVA